MSSINQSLEEWVSNTELTFREFSRVFLSVQTADGSVLAYLALSVLCNMKTPANLINSNVDTGTMGL